MIFESAGNFAVQLMRKIEKNKGDTLMKCIPFAGAKMVALIRGRLMVAPNGCVCCLADWKEERTFSIRLDID